MLALTRRVGEEVVIGDPCHPLGVVRIVDIHGDKVRLSFDFPREMQINRRELAEQKALESAQPPTPSPAPPAAPTAPPTTASAPPSAPTSTPASSKPATSARPSKPSPSSRKPNKPQSPRD